jgi:hypothetical protein
MKTEQPGSGNSARPDRRGFLAQLVGLAAAATLPSQRAVAAAELAAPAALPTIQLGKHRLSRLVAGSNPILGYSYAGKHADRHMKDYFTPERTTEFLQNCERAGITTHQFAFENIKPTDGVIVGMFPWFFDEVSANAQFARELGKA